MCKMRGTYVGIHAYNMDKLHRDSKVSRKVAQMRVTVEQTPDNAECEETVYRIDARHYAP